MLEKEPQFFGKEAVPEQVSEKEEAVKLTEFSKELEAFAEKDEDYLKEKAAEAEKIMAEEKEATLEEKSGAVRSYLEKSFIKKEVREPSFRREDKEETREFFRGLTPDKLEAHLGKEDLNLVFRVISERDRLLGQIKEDDLTEEEIRKFAEQNGYEMLPWRINKTLDELNFLSIVLESRFLGNIMFPGLSSWEEEKKHLTGQLKVSLVELRRENEVWQKYSKFEREKEEKPMEIKGFEKLDGPTEMYKGEELLRIAAEILPRGILSANIKSIEYSGKREPANKAKYGFDGESAATFVSDDKCEKGDIVFHKTSDSSSRVDYFNNVPFILGHEWGHSLDPRLVDQKDLSPREQLRMVKEWEEVRAKEEEWSSYVKKINKPDKIDEESVKSQESLAESAAKFLNNPFTLKELYPQRSEFMVNLFKKRFPEFSLEKSLEAKEMYTICLFGFPKGEKEKNAIDEFLKRAEKEKL